MKKIGKKQREAMVAKQIEQAVVGLQIPMMAITAIYREGERLLEPANQPASFEEFVEKLQAFAIEKGAVRA